MEFVDLGEQYRRYRIEIDAAMAAVMAHGRFIMGPEVAAFEDELAAWLGHGREVVSCANGTDALQLILRALDIGPGDEVITTAFTWIASAEVIGLVGATPVFVDIDPATYLLDTDAVAAAITERTRAIIAVSLFGQAIDPSALAQAVGEREIVVIEDAAQSLGAERGGVPSGALTPIAATSFFPAKPLGCYGDGGAVIAPPGDLLDRIRALRTHGGRERHHHPWLGTNSRLDTLQAAVLRAKLPHFADEIAARQTVAARYSELLDGRLSGLFPDRVAAPTVATGCRPVWAQYCLRVPERDRVLAALRARDIPCAVYYPMPVHRQPVFASTQTLPEVERACREVLSLPMHPFLTASDQEQVIAALGEAIAEVTA